MEFKVVISDPGTGKSYQRDIKDENARRFRGKKIGDEIDGSVLGLTGYKLAVTGGSDRGGFPMKKGVIGKAASRILMKGGVGYKAIGCTRKRKRVRGEVIDDDIVQINARILVKGKKKIEELLGLGMEGGQEEKKEVEVKVEKPPEEKKVAEKAEVLVEKKPPEEKKPKVGAKEEKKVETRKSQEKPGKKPKEDKSKE
jgi:small subunit ribosomal protein S6e